MPGLCSVIASSKETGLYGLCTSRLFLQIVFVELQTTDPSNLEEETVEQKKYVCKEWLKKIDKENKEMKIVKYLTTCSTSFHSTMTSGSIACNA